MAKIKIEKKTSYVLTLDEDELRVIHSILGESKAFAADSSLTDSYKLFEILDEVME